jgi:hypothetical protein
VEPRLALVASPFTGAAAWRPLAAVLPGAVAVDDVEVRGPDWYEGVARRVSAAMGTAPWIAVLHSGAGGFAPALAEAGAAGFVLVDAVRPHPGRSLHEVDADLVVHLERRAERGRLPPWNAWFETDPLPRLLPDAHLRAAFVADLPRTPVAFLHARPPASDRWERLPAAYLQLSSRYARQADWAESRGWPVRRAGLHHLAIASHADSVAQMIAELAQAVDNLAGTRA